MRVAVAAAVLLAAGPAASTVLADWSLEEVAARADRVDLGVVTKRVTRRASGELFTDVHLQVERTLKGPKTDALVVTQLGGVDGDEVVELVGDARLPVGARVVLFTYRHKDGRRYLVGMALGAWRVVGDQLRQRVESALVDERGRLSPPPGPRAVPLSRVEAAVEVRP